MRITHQDGQKIQLAQQGFIQLNGSQIRVDDWNRLHVLAKAGCPMEVGGKN